MKQARRMELKELHVPEPSAGAICHRDTVPCRYVWIGRVQVHFARTARRQHGSVGGHRLDAAATFIKYISPDTTIGSTELTHGDQVHPHVPLAK